MHHTVICFVIHLTLFLIWRCFHVFSFFSYGFLEIVSYRLIIVLYSLWFKVFRYSVEMRPRNFHKQLLNLFNSVRRQRVWCDALFTVQARFWRNSLFRRFFSIVKCIRDPTGFHSDKLHDALQEGDTKTVARIILGKNKVSAKEMLLEIILCFLLMLLLLKRDAWFWLITLDLLVPKT